MAVGYCVTTLSLSFGGGYNERPENGNEPGSFSLLSRHSIRVVLWVGGCSFFSFVVRVFFLVVHFK